MFRLLSILFVLSLSLFTLGNSDNANSSALKKMRLVKEQLLEKCITSLDKHRNDWEQNLRKMHPNWGEIDLRNRCRCAIRSITSLINYSVKPDRYVEASKIINNILNNDFYLTSKKYMTNEIPTRVISPFTASIYRGCFGWKKK